MNQLLILATASKMISNKFDFSFMFIVLKAGDRWESKECSSTESMNIVKLISLHERCMEDCIVSRVFLSKVRFIVVKVRETFDFFEWADPAKIELLRLCREHVNS